MQGWAHALIDEVDVADLVHHMLSVVPIAGPQHNLGDHNEHEDLVHALEDILYAHDHKKVFHAHHGENMGLDNSEVGSSMDIPSEVAAPVGRNYQDAGGCYGYEEVGPLEVALVGLGCWLLVCQVPH